MQKYVLYVSYAIKILENVLSWAVFSVTNSDMQHSSKSASCFVL